MSVAAAALIFLHGLGDNGGSWRFLSRAIRSAPFQLLTPTAPTVIVGLEPSWPMPAWFDLEHLPVTPTTRDDVHGFDASIRTIHGLVDGLVAKGVPSERIIVGGFSQGAALSLAAGLRYPQRLGGLILLSGWTAMRESYPAAASPAQAGLPVYVAHGSEDDKVVYELGEETARLLKAWGHPVTFKSFDDGHTVPMEVIEELDAFAGPILRGNNKA